MDKKIPFKSVLDQTGDVVIITEIEPLDEPFGPKILYVNQSFTTLTGYRQEDVLGKTPRILQGDKTDKNTLKKIRDALQKKEPVHAELLNYAKDQTEYWLDFTIVPIKESYCQIWCMALGGLPIRFFHYLYSIFKFGVVNYQR